MWLILYSLFSQCASLFPWWSRAITRQQTVFILYGRVNIWTNWRWMTRRYNSSKFWSILREFIVVDYGYPVAYVLSVCTAMRILACWSCFCRFIVMFVAGLFYSIHRYAWPIIFSVLWCPQTNIYKAMKSRTHGGARASTELDVVPVADGVAFS